MDSKIMFGAVFFILGWFFFYLFVRQLLFNFFTAYPLIRKMRKLYDELIAIGAARYTTVSVVVNGLLCAVIVGLILWLCPAYMQLSFAIGVALGLFMYLNKLSPSTRAMFDAFCAGYCRFVPDDELRMAMYNKKTGQIKSRLKAMGIKETFIPEFKN